MDLLGGRPLGISLPFLFSSNIRILYIVMKQLVHMMFVN